MATDNPAWQSPTYTQMKRAWNLLLDIYGGTMRMRDAIMAGYKLGRLPVAVPVQAYLTDANGFEGPTTYLPKHEKEQDRDYLIRLFNTELFPALRHTIRGLSGMVMRRDPELADNVPARLQAQWEDIDYAGTHGAVFARQVLDNMLLFGFHGILVEAPAYDATTAALTIAQEAQQGGRPYWVHCRADQILSARMTTLDNGEHTLSQLVLQFDVQQPEGEFAERTVCQWLRLNLLPLPDGTYAVGFRRYEKVTTTTGADDYRVVDSGTMRNQTRIPFVLAVAGELTAPLETRPPLLDLAYLNLAHFRVQSDHRHSLHMSSVPMLVFVGRDTKSPLAVVGPNTAIDIPQGGDAKFVEHSGTALGQTREELKDLEGRMAQIGLAMLQRETGAAETAEAKRLDKGEQDSALSTIARALEDALETALQFHAIYLGEKTGGEVTVNRDFEDATMTVEEMNAYSAQVASGQLTLDTMWTLMVQGQRLPPDFDAEEEQAKLDAVALPPLDLGTPPPTDTPPTTDEPASWQIEDELVS